MKLDKRLMIIICLVGFACESARKEDTQVSFKTESNHPTVHQEPSEMNVIDSNASTENLIEQAPLNGEDSSHEYLPEGFYILPSSHANIIRTFDFFKPDEDGFLQGFNLDGAISKGNETNTCGIADRITQDGVEGVDNQLGVLWTALEPLVGEAVKALLANAIQDGRLLLMVELSQVADLRNDDRVSLSIFRGLNTPVVNAKGLVVADQTFEIDPDFNMSIVDGVVIREGHVRAGPIEFRVPIEIFDANFSFRVQNGQIDFYIDQDGSFKGIMGGEIVVKEVLDELLASNASSEAMLVQPFFENNADLGYEDGKCTKISAAFGFSGTTAFVMRKQDASSTDEDNEAY